MNQSRAIGEAVPIHDDSQGVIPRPQPPAELTREEALVWTELCNSVSVDHFAPVAYGLMVAYCRAVVLSRHLWRRLQDIERRRTFDPQAFAKLSREYRAASGLVVQCLRQLRCTPLSSYLSDRSPLPTAQPKPWLS